MSHKDQSGFIMLAITIFVSIALLSLVGWSLYGHYYGNQNSVANSSSQSSKPTISSPNPATPINPYTGWKTYCSTMGGLCLQYPTDWQEKAVRSPAPALATINDPVAITSPSGALEVLYHPSLNGLGGACPDATCFFKVEFIDQTYMPNNIGLKVYKGIWNNKGYNNAIVPYYFISSDKKMSFYHLQQNQFVDTNAFYTDFTSPTDNTLSETVDVEDVPQKDYGSISDAETWFSQPEVKTAGEILSSVTVQK